MKKKNTHSSGQILIESIVSFGIIASTLLAVIALLVLTLRVSRTNARKTISSNLSKETLEVVREVRDNSIPTSENLKFFEIDATAAQYYRLNYRFQQTVGQSDAPSGGWFLEKITDPVQQESPEASIYAINYDGDKDVWLPAVGDPMPTPSSFGYYYRQIKIQDLPGKNPGDPADTNKKRVDVIISFIDKGASKHISYTTVFANWK
ncbi:MAG: hypothetical protein WCP97_05855 [bacterium]